MSACVCMCAYVSLSSDGCALVWAVSSAHINLMKSIIRFFSLHILLRKGSMFTKSMFIYLLCWWIRFSNLILKGLSSFLLLDVFRSYQHCNDLSNSETSYFSCWKWQLWFNITVQLSECCFIHSETCRSRVWKLVPYFLQAPCWVQRLRGTLMTQLVNATNNAWWSLSSSKPKTLLSSWPWTLHLDQHITEILFIHTDYISLAAAQKEEQYFDGL